MASDKKECGCTPTPNLPNRSSVLFEGVGNDPLTPTATGLTLPFAQNGVFRLPKHMVDETPPYEPTPKPNSEMGRGLNAVFAEAAHRFRSYTGISSDQFPTDTLSHQAMLHLLQFAEEDDTQDAIAKAKGKLPCEEWVIKVKLDRPLPPQIEDDLYKEVAEQAAGRIKRAIENGDDPADQLGKKDDWRGVGLPLGTIVEWIGISTDYTLCIVWITLKVTVPGSPQLPIGPPPRLPPAPPAEVPAPPPRRPQPLPGEDPYRPGGLPVPTAALKEVPDGGEGDYSDNPANSPCSVQGRYEVRFNNENVLLDVVERGPKNWRQAYPPSDAEAKDMFKSDIDAISQSFVPDNYTSNLSSYAVSAGLAAAAAAKLNGRCPSDCPALTILGVDGWELTVQGVGLGRPTVVISPWPNAQEVRGYKVKLRQEVRGNISGSVWVRYQCD